MSLVKNYFLRNFTYKSISACSYLFNDNRLNCAQYYTLNNPANIQSNLFKYKRLGDDSRRVMSVFQSVKEVNFTVTSKLRSFAKSFPTYLPFFGVKYKRIGYLWFNTLEEVKTEDFFTLFQMPDTFYSRFQIIELHVWMLLYHLPKGDRAQKYIRLGVIEAMWADSEKRAKLLQSINKNFKKNFRSLYGEFLLAQLLYDYSFNKSDTALSSAVWCNFFNKEDVDPRFIEALVCYIRYQMHHLDKLNFADLNIKAEKLAIWEPAGPLINETLKKS